MGTVIDRIRLWSIGLLRWSEKYTKTDMVYLAHGGFWLLLERAAAILLGFALSVAFANLLEPEKYGVYKYVLSAIGIMGAFSLAGMATAVNQAVARGFQGAIKAGFKASLRWSVGTIVAAFGAAAYYFFHGNSVLGISFLIAGSLTPIISAASLYDNFLIGTKRFSQKSFYGTIRNGLPPLLLIGALFFTQDPAVLVAVYFLTTAATTYFCYKDVLRRYVKNDATDPDTLSYGKHLSIINILAVLAAQADRIFIFTLLGGTPLALFAIAEAIPDQIRSLSGITGMLILPKLAQRPLAELKRELPRKALIMFGVAVLCAGAYIAAAPLFFSIFFPKYMGAVLFSQVYALTILIIPTTLFSNTLFAHARKRELYIQRIVSAGTEIGLLLILVPAFGIWGAIWATLASYVVATILLLWQFSRLK